MDNTTCDFLYIRTTFRRINLTACCMWNPEAYKWRIYAVFHPLLDKCRSSATPIPSHCHPLWRRLSQHNPDSIYLANFRSRRRPDCDFWARRCILISAATLQGHLFERIHPLSVLGFFLSPKATPTLTIYYSSTDSTITLLYTVAKEHMRIVCGQQSEIRQRVQQSLQQATLKGVTTGIKTVRYTEDGSEHLREQTRVSCVWLTKRKKDLLCCEIAKFCP